MRRQLLPAVRMLLLMTVVTGILYTATVTGIAQTVFPHQADGSLVEHEGRTVGSELVGQWFSAPGFFHTRPSAVGYDPRLSGATNYGPTNPEYWELVQERAASYRETNGLDPGAAVPVDAVTSSGSGLDPHISVANARLQAPRVAEERDLPLVLVLDLIELTAAETAVWVAGQPAVDVLLLNLALEELS